MPLKTSEARTRANVDFGWWTGLASLERRGQESESHELLTTGDDDTMLMMMTTTMRATTDKVTSRTAAYVALLLVYVSLSAMHSANAWRNDRSKLKHHHRHFFFLLSFFYRCSLLLPLDYTFVYPVVRTMSVLSRSIRLANKKKTYELFFFSSTPLLTFTHNLLSLFFLSRRITLGHWCTVVNLWEL